MKPKYNSIFTHDYVTCKSLKMATFDIETSDDKGRTIEGFNYFIEGAIYNPEKYEDVQYFSTLDELIDELLKQVKYTVYAHNGGGFDFKHIIPNLINRLNKKEIKSIIPLIQGENKYIQIKIELNTKSTKSQKNNDYVILQDSYSFLNMSLAAAAKAFDVPTQKMDSPVGVYTPSRDREYLRADVISLFEIMVTAQDMSKELFDTPLGITAGGTAMKAWKRSLKANGKEPELIYSRQYGDGIASLYHLAYSGGAVICPYSNIKFENVTQIDLKAAYPGAMRTVGVPKGPARLTGEYNGLPGVYRCRVNIQPDKMPHSIIRGVQPDGVTSSYGHGEFSTVITHIELEYLIELDCEVEVMWGYEHPEGMFFPFNSLINKIEKLETEQSEFKPFTKILRNALYGKFGTKYINKEFIISTTGKELSDEYYNILEINGEEIPFLYARNKENTSDYIAHHWAAYICAAVRIQLHRAIMDIGPENVIYCDTDSIHYVNNNQEITINIEGKKFGEFTTEAVGLTEIPLGPKFYVKLINELIFIKHKGYCPKNNDELGKQEFIDAMNGKRPKSFKMKSLCNMKSVISNIGKDDVLLARELNRGITDVTNSVKTTLSKTHLPKCFSDMPHGALLQPLYKLDHETMFFVDTRKKQ